MASGGAAIPTSAAAVTTPTSATGTTKTLSASLWWDSFVVLSDDLDRAAAGPVSDALVRSFPLPPPTCIVPEHSGCNQYLTVLQAKRIKNHHAWFRGSVSMFGKPNETSRSALDACEVVVGEQRLTIKTELKETALNASKCLVILLPCLTCQGGGQLNYTVWLI
jgi:hypothetical protein